MCIIAWKPKEKKLVKLLTTHHPDEMVPSTMKKKGHAIPLFILKPTCVPEYNHGMNAVDCLDQNISYYPCIRKTVKWTKKFVIYLMQITLFNSYILYKSVTGSGIHHLDFLMQVVSAWTTFQVPANLLPPVQESEEEEPESGAEAAAGADADGEAGARLRHGGPRTPRSDPLTRLDGNRLAHYLVRNRTRRICRVHKRHGKGKQTWYSCRSCAVPLCIGWCNAVYHAKHNYKNCPLKD